MHFDSANMEQSVAGQIRHLDDIFANIFQSHDSIDFKLLQALENIFPDSLVEFDLKRSSQSPAASNRVSVLEVANFLDRDSEA